MFKFNIIINTTFVSYYIIIVKTFCMVSNKVLRHVSDSTVNTFCTPYMHKLMKKAILLIGII